MDPEKMLQTKKLKVIMEIREQLKLKNHLTIMKELYSFNLISMQDYRGWLADIAEGQRLGKVVTEDEEDEE